LPIPQGGSQRTEGPHRGLTPEMHRETAPTQAATQHRASQQAGVRSPAPARLPDASARASADTSRAGSQRGRPSARPVNLEEWNPGKKSAAHGRTESAVRRFPRSGWRAPVECEKADRKPGFHACFRRGPQEA
jgi:hypothetical protein